MKRFVSFLISFTFKSKFYGVTTTSWTFVTGMTITSLGFVRKLALTTSGHVFIWFRRRWVTTNLLLTWLSTRVVVSRWVLWTTDFLKRNLPSTDCEIQLLPSSVQNKSRQILNLRLFAANWNLRWCRVGWCPFAVSDQVALVPSQ